MYIIVITSASFCFIQQGQTKETSISFSIEKESQPIIAVDQIPKNSEAFEAKLVQSYFGLSDEIKSFTFIEQGNMKYFILKGEGSSQLSFCSSKQFEEFTLETGPDIKWKNYFPR